MKLYVVTANTYDCGYGAEISLFGVYTDRESAESRKKQLDDIYVYESTITEVDNDTNCEEYLGGYIE